MHKAIFGVVVVLFAFAAAGDGMDLVWAAGEPAGDLGLRLLDGADGTYEVTSKEGIPCVTTKPGATPPSQYLYFNVDDGFLTDGAGALYLSVEYYDSAPGSVFSIQYDSADGEGIPGFYRDSEDRWAVGRKGRQGWKKSVFLLEQPQFGNRQNLGADFRLAGSLLFIKSLRLSRVRPAECDRAEDDAVADVRKLVKIGKGGELIVGGFDPADRENGRSQVRALKAAAPALKSLGVTSHEGYVRWNLCEPAPGEYDWSVYDAYVEVYRQHGLKWVPFVIAGPAYTLPDWYYKQPGSQGYVCLEHGETSDVESLWNPELRGHVTRFLQAFCEHYRDSGVIESILLGITGNYGEAIYVASGNDWTASTHGEYHTHAGFWAGDPFAVKSFQDWLEDKYGDVCGLNGAWKTRHGAFGDVRPFLRAQAPNNRAWLDFCQWYTGSMTEWARFWMQETRKHFDGEIYLCTGGHAPAEHGADFGEQCKLAAEIGGGVRITNESSDYEANYAITRWVASAAHQYGAYFSYEPAGEVNADGVIARVYNATASGARGLHYYYPNLFGSEQARNNFVAWGGSFKQRRPDIEIAVYYPQTSIQLTDNHFVEYVRPLRDYFDFDYMSDRQILDGGLGRVKALVLLWGNVSEAAVWKTVTEWVQSGGVVVYPAGMGTLQTVEGDTQWHRTLFRASGNLGQGRVERYYGEPNQAGYFRFVSRKLALAPELSALTRRMLTADGRDDDVYVTALERGRLLWLNYTNAAVTKSRITLPPMSIVEQPRSGLIRRLGQTVRLQP